MGILSPSRRDCPHCQKLSLFAWSWQSLGVGMFSLWWSNYSQLRHSSRSAFVLRRQSFHRLSYGRVALLNQLRLGSCTLAIRALQALLLEVNGRPDVLPHQSLRNLPALIQAADLPLVVNSANEVQASGSQRHLARERVPLAWFQPSALPSPLGSFNAQPLQPRRLILFVPGEELGALASEVRDGGEGVFVTEALRPELMAAFDQPLTLGLAGRNEDRVHAPVEHEP